MLKDKKILLGITGSIAAYKSLLLVRMLVKAGAEVRVILTPAAQDFVTPLSLSTLSRNPVLENLSEAGSWSNHVSLGRWADLMLIAPLSCNTLSKMASGLCDNLLLAVYLSATCPVVVAPAMDEDMWKHPSTVENLKRINSFGNRIIPVGNGELASGLFGEGRMAEPEEILEFISQFNSETPSRIGTLSGKKALVTAGPTYESIDPVRFIGNHSSGKMGISIARELSNRGADVTMVLGPTGIDFSESPGWKIINVQSADQMYEACMQEFPDSDIAVLAAAVADYKPISVSVLKIKKTEEDFSLKLTRTNDILKALGQLKRDGQILVGFALENSNEKNYALEKLRTKNADMIVLNSLKDQGAGFGYDTNKITVFEKDGAETPFPLQNKQQVAKHIVDRIVNRLYA